MKNKQIATKKVSYKETDPSVIVYRGPIGLPSSVRSMGELRTMELRWTDDIISSGAGVCNNVIANNPSLAEDWSSFAAIYNEYRVLGFRVTYKPWNKYSKVTTTCAPGFVVLDNESSSSLTSTSQAVAYSTVKFETLEDTFVHEARMSDTEQADFNATSSVASSQWIKFYFDGLSNSATYGTIYVQLMVQFKGQR